MVSGASLLAYDPSHLNNDDDNNTQPPLRVITMKEISNLLPALITKDTLQNQKEAYIAYSSSKGTVAPVQTLGQPPAAGPMSGGPNCQVCIKTGYIHKDTYFVTKIAGGGSDGYGNTGLVLLSSQTSLQPRYVLQDNAILTEIRTAAATALVSHYFLPAKVTCIGILGGGVQAFWQLRFLTLVTECRNVVIKTRSHATAEAFVSKMKCNELDTQWNITIANDNEEAFKKCQLIHTLTPSREPILLANHLDLESQDVHISAVGADSPGKRELGSCLLDRADVIACDSLVQTVERGEGQYCSETQVESIVEIGTLLKESDTMPSEKREKKKKSMLTIFDTSGIALQDVCIAQTVCAILEKANEK